MVCTVWFIFVLIKYFKIYQHYVVWKPDAQIKTLLTVKSVVESEVGQLFCVGLLTSAVWLVVLFQM